MRRPAHLHVSNYINYSTLADGKSVLAVHGYSLAVDIFSNKLARSLMQQELTPCHEDKPIEELLVQRGYLTGRSVDEENAFIHGVRDLFEKKKPSKTDFRLELGAAIAPERRRNLQEQAFLAISQMKGIESGGSIEIDSSSVDAVHVDGLEEAMLLARDWGLRTHLKISGKQLADAVDLLKIHQPARISICTRELDHHWTQPQNGAGADLPPFRHILEIIAFQTAVELLIVTDDINDEALKSVFQNIDAIRARIYADGNRLLTAVPVTEKEGPLVPRNISNMAVFPICWSELPDYRQLQEYIWSSRLVRFRPSFLSFARMFDIDKFGNISLTVHPGRKHGIVGSVSEQGYQLDHELLDRLSVAHTTGELPAECRTCTLSLICGSNCRVADEREKEHFRDKLTRLGSLLLLNVHPSEIS
jgi:radical SAM protein with 4Fe4S-binding SPASM domain